MKMPRSISAAALALALVATAGAVFSNPLRRSDEAIHTWLLKSVPPGSDIKYLMSVADQKGWKVNSVWNGDHLHADWGGIDGARIAWVHLGGYRNVFRTDLDSFWAFDETGHLIDVKTRRMTDGL